MKNYEEMANDVLHRIKEYEAIKVKRKKAYTRFAYSFATAVVIFVIGLNVAKLAKGNGKETVGETGIHNQTQEIVLPDKIIWDGDLGQDFGQDQNLDAETYKPWHDKWVYYNLYYELEDCDEDTAFAIAICFSLGADEGFKDFIYNGKSGSEYEAEIQDELALVRMMNDLLYDGQLLNDRFYITDEWQEDYYQEMINRYGEELVSKYVVPGNEFMEDELISDIEELYGYDKDYNEALEAYYKTLKASIIEEVREQGVYVKDTPDRCVLICVTAKEFERLKISADLVMYEFAGEGYKELCYPK